MKRKDPEPEETMETGMNSVLSSTNSLMNAPTLPNISNSGTGSQFSFPPQPTSTSSIPFPLPPIQQVSQPAQQIPPALIHPSATALPPPVHSSLPPVPRSVPSLQSVLAQTQQTTMPMATQIPPSQISPAMSMTPSQIPPPPPTISPSTSPAPGVGLARPPGPPAPAASGSTVKFENALDFLDQVKMQFANQPKVYNQFLDIMKDFKAQCIDTPGVIARVSELFKGHRNLILGFNTFLPPGYKIEYVPEVADQPKAESGPMQPAPLPPTPQGHPGAPVVPAGSQRKQPEFDHARNYVKKIKMRFALQPQIYKAFLEILHTYHKEQHTIKDVYEQVATLFQNHQDLLEEFAQFLPDPVASQNIAAMPKQQQAQQPKAPKGRGGKVKAEKVVEPKERPGPRAQRQTKPPVATTPPPEERPPNGSYEELNFFNTVKQRLNSVPLYMEFLKCLTLFSQNIISRLELVLLVKDLLSKHRDLFERFQQFIGFDEANLELMERQHEEKQAPAPTEIDFKTCKRYGPSYRALPKNFQKATCSGRTELCASVLNDIWVSVPTGSEDYGFKNSRKNQYEEMLFKCEDDRFELDLVIELNASTIRALERILKSISEMSEEDSAKFKLDTNLDILHIRSIERIYGDKGTDVLDALYNSPAVTIPVILKRLKQKDHEWIKARREWNKIWREVNEKNYYKALDHQSFFFKQNDKKNLSPKVLVAEIKQKYQESLKLREKQRRRLEGQENNHTKDGPQAPADSLNDTLEKRNEKADAMDVDNAEKPSTDASKNAQQEEALKTYHLKYTITDKHLVNVIFNLVTAYADKALAKPDKEKIDTFIKHFVRVFFFVPDEKSDDDGYYNNDQPMEEATKSRLVQLFFGNNTFYVFFRLFEVLYERLAKAKTLAAQPVLNSQFVFLLNPEKHKKPTDPREKFNVFLKLLNNVMFSQLEQGAYEDECRYLFGVDTYLLFTLDKVIAQLAKQLQALLSEEKCSKLLALYSYEYARPTGCTEEIYHSNCVELLGDERCYKFEYEKSPQNGSFTILLLDHRNNPPKFVEFSADKREKWSQYAEQYIGEDSHLDLQKHKVFLKRNKRKVDNTDARLDQLDIFNGLECRICLSTYRLFYVEHTEDYSYKRAALAKAKKFASKLTLPQKKQNIQHIVEKLVQKVT